MDLTVAVWQWQFIRGLLIASFQVAIFIVGYFHVAAPTNFLVIVALLLKLNMATGQSQFENAVYLRVVLKHLSESNETTEKFYDRFKRGFFFEDEVVTEEDAKYGAVNVMVELIQRSVEVLVLLGLVGHFVVSTWWVN